MSLVLTCVLCAISGVDGVSVGATDRPSVLEDRLSIDHGDLATPTGPVPLALTHLADQGSGDGDHGDHSGHMGPMWILMGVMMAVMVVGMGVYLMRHAQQAGTTPGVAAIGSPTQLALPVGVTRSPGG